VELTTITGAAPAKYALTSQRIVTFNYHPAEQALALNNGFQVEIILNDSPKAL
jgi:hypothetical protein